jgi:hypothetical protein
MKRPQMIAVALIAPMLLIVGCGGGKTITCGFNACQLAISFNPTTPISLAQGKTATLSVTVTSNNGYNGTADLDVGASDLPSGVTASFAPKQVSLASGGTNSSTLTLTASISAPLVALKDLTINAVGQGASSSTKFKLNITGAQTVTISPKTATVIAKPGAAATTFTATAVNTSGTINWTLSGPGSITLSTGTSTQYTPPNSAASSVAVTATLTASVAGTSISDAATITIDKDPNIMVSGKVFKYNGSAANGVQVQIEDAIGVKTPSGGVTTGTDGSFQVSNVLPPYTVSAWVPGLTASTFRPITWTGVKRIDPQIVLPSNVPISNWATTCTRADAIIKGTLSPAVATGSTGYMIYIGPGITFRIVAFDDPNFAFAVNSVAAGSSSYSLAIPFDTGLCKTQTTGGLIYVEREDATGNYTRATVINPVSVTTGNTTPQDISSATATLLTLTTTLNAPTGTPSAKYYPTFRVNGLTSHCCNADFVFPAAKEVLAGSTETFKVPALAGVEYRIHVHGSPFPAQTGTYWSTNVSSDANIAVNLLNLIGPIGPSGALTGSTPFTPTFSYNPVTNAVLYQIHIKNVNGETIWTGYTSTTSVKLPNLPPPAQLSSGTTYTWSVDAISLYGNPSIDDLLDGRMKFKNWDFANSHYHAEEVIGASYNYQGTTFNTP